MSNNCFILTEDIVSTLDYGMNRLMGINIKLNFDEISDYDFPLNEAFGLQINYEDVIYCFVVKFSSKNKNLICTGPGAHERDKVLDNGEILKPPFFDRWSWYKYFDESFIAYADPMLCYDDEIKIAWFVGTKEQWFLENLSLIIRELAKNQNIRNDNILFYGSSGGGFTSVVLATLIRDSKVLINNSQLFILNYWESMVNQLFNMLYDSFETTDKDAIIWEIKHRLDVIELFKKENYVPYITYYVNSESKPDVLNHARPLIEKIHELDEFNGLNVVYYREIKNIPHQPLPRDETKKLIKRYCKDYLYNGDETLKGKVLYEGKYVNNLEKKVKQLNKKYTKSEKKYDDLLTSASWKITKPFRKFKRQFKRN